MACDDGGELWAGGFHIVFVAECGGLFAVGVSWARGEGLSLALFVSGKGTGLARVLEDCRHRMPECCSTKNAPLGSGTHQRWRRRMGQSGK